MKRKYVLLWAIPLICLGLSGCGIRVENVEEEIQVSKRTLPETVEIKEYMDLSLQAEEKYNFFFVCPNADNPYWDMVKEGIADADQYYGVNTETIGTPLVEETDRYEYLKQAVACKPDGILTQTFLTEEYQEYTGKVIDSGIPIIFANSNVPARDEMPDRTDYKKIVVGVNDYEAGYEAGKLMVEATGGKAKIGILAASSEEMEIGDRGKGFCDAIEAEEGMEVFYTDAYYGLLETEMQSVENLYEKYGINAVFGTSATDAIAAVQSLEEKTENPVIIGFDNLDATLEYIDEGKIYATIMQNPYYIGWMGVQLLIQSIQNPKELPPYVNVGTTVITRENVQEYMKK